MYHLGMKHHCTHQVHTARNVYQIEVGTRRRSSKRIPVSTPGLYLYTRCLLRVEHDICGEYTRRLYLEECTLDVCTRGGYLERCTAVVYLNGCTPSVFLKGRRLKAGELDIKCLPGGAYAESLKSWIPSAYLEGCTLKAWRVKHQVPTWGVYAVRLGSWTLNAYPQGCTLKAWRVEYQVLTWRGVRWKPGKLTTKCLLGGSTL